MSELIKITVKSKIGTKFDIDVTPQTKVKEVREECARFFKRNVSSFYISKAHPISIIPDDDNIIDHGKEFIFFSDRKASLQNTNKSPKTEENENQAEQNQQPPILPSLSPPILPIIPSNSDIPANNNNNNSNPSYYEYPQISTPTFNVLEPLAPQPMDHPAVHPTNDNINITNDQIADAFSQFMSSKQLTEDQQATFKKFHEKRPAILLDDLFFLYRVANFDSGLLAAILDTVSSIERCEAEAQQAGNLAQAAAAPSSCPPPVQRQTIGLQRPSLPPPNFAAIGGALGGRLGSVAPNLQQAGSTQQPQPTLQQPSLPQPNIPQQAPPPPHQPALQQPTLPQPNFPQPAPPPLQQPTLPQQSPPPQQPTLQQPTLPQPSLSQPTIRQQSPPLQQPTLPQPNFPQQAPPPLQQPTLPQPNIPQQPQPILQQPSLPQPNIPQQAPLPPHQLNRQRPTLPQPNIPQQAPPPLQQPTLPQPSLPQPTIPQPALPPQQPTLPQPAPPPIRAPSLPQSNLPQPAPPLQQPAAPPSSSQQPSHAPPPPASQQCADDGAKVDQFLAGKPISDEQKKAFKSFHEQRKAISLDDLYFLFEASEFNADACKSLLEGI